MRFREFALIKPNSIFFCIFIIFAELLIEYQQLLNFQSTREFQSANGDVYTRDRDAFLATISSFFIVEG